MNQKEKFLAGEGDEWYKRNQDTIKDDDIIVETMKRLNLKPEILLEIGCGTGKRLNLISQNFNCACLGIDPSAKAIQNAKNTLFGDGIDFEVGTADKIKYADAVCDVVIYGFCLYLCDRKDLFKIAMEGDRILEDKGYIIIYDFYPPQPYKNKYAHLEGLYSYKMDYSKLFTWNPAYKIIHHEITGHSGVEKRHEPNETLGLTVLYKDMQNAYPESVY